MPSNITQSTLFTTEHVSYSIFHQSFEDTSATVSSPDCKHDRRGMHYQGYTNHTWNGHACIPWIKTRFKYAGRFPDDTDNVDTAFNHCRNPTRDSCTGKNSEKKILKICLFLQNLEKCSQNEQFFTQIG